MPLKRGRSKKVISENIAELMHSYGSKGSIGNSRPASKAKAQRQAIAIAMREAGVGRKRGKRAQHAMGDAIDTATRRRLRSRTKKKG